MIVFGGFNGSDVLDEVWELSLTPVPQWTEREVRANDSIARYGHTTVLEEKTGRLVSFGGYGEDRLPRNDVSILPLRPKKGKWSTLVPGGGPTPRAWSVAGYDPLNRRMLVMGGRSEVNLGDTWALSLEGQVRWTQIQPENRFPAGRNSHTAILDPVRNRMIIFGGEKQLINDNETWGLSLGPSPKWTRLTPDSGPPPRSGHAAIYDSLRDRMLIFGGYQYKNRANFNDLWSLTLSEPPSWSRVITQGEPPAPGLGHSAVYDTKRDQMIVFGGSRAYSDEFSNAVYVLALDHTPQWSRIEPLGEGPDGRYVHTAFYDEVRDQMVVMGGKGIYLAGSTGSYRNDIWALSLGSQPAWTLIHRDYPGSPHARYGHASAYDPKRDRMIVFGGCCLLLNDIWHWDMKKRYGWLLLNPQGTPPSPRFTLTAVFDVKRDRMVLFGGRKGGEEYDKLWTVAWGEPVSLPSPSVARTVEEIVADGTLPSHLALRTSPNPLSGSARITYELPNPLRVSLAVFDVQGRMVSVLVDEPQEVGEHVVTWETDRMASGMYFVRLRVGEESRVEKVIVLDR